MVGPRSWAIACALTAFAAAAPAAATGGAAEDCLPGLEVTTGEGWAAFDWPDVNGTYYYNVSAFDTDEEPPALVRAEAGMSESEFNWTQPPGNMSFTVSAWDSDFQRIATFCAVEGYVAPGPATEVPFFPAGWAVALGLAGIVGAGFVVARRQ